MNLDIVFKVIDCLETMLQVEDDGTGTGKKVGVGVLGPCQGVNGSDVPIVTLIAEAFRGRCIGRERLHLRVQERIRVSVRIFQQLISEVALL